MTIEGSLEEITEGEFIFCAVILPSSKTTSLSTYAKRDASLSLSNLLEDGKPTSFLNTRNYNIDPHSKNFRNNPAKRY